MLRKLMKRIRDCKNQQYRKDGDELPAFFYDALPHVQSLWYNKIITTKELHKLSSFSERNTYLYLYRKRFISKNEVPKVFFRKEEKETKKEKPQKSPSFRFNPKKVHPVLKRLHKQGKISETRLVNLSMLPAREIYLCLFKEGYIKRSDVPNHFFEEVNYHFEGELVVEEKKTEKKQNTNSEEKQTSEKEPAPEKQASNDSDHTTEQYSSYSYTASTYEDEETDDFFDEFSKEEEDDNETYFSDSREENETYSYDFDEEEDEEYPPLYEYAHNVLQKLYDCGTLDYYEFDSYANLTEEQMYQKLFYYNYISWTDIPEYLRGTDEYKDPFDLDFPHDNHYYKKY